MMKMMKEVTWRWGPIRPRLLVRECYGWIDKFQTSLFVYFPWPSLTQNPFRKFQFGEAEEDEDVYLCNRVGSIHFKRPSL